MSPHAESAHRNPDENGKRKKKEAGRTAEEEDKNEDKNKNEDKEDVNREEDVEGDAHRRMERRRIAVVEPPSPFDEALVGGDLRLPARIFTYLAVGALAAYPLIALGRGYDAELGALILTLAAALAAAPRRAQPIEARLLYAAKYYTNTASKAWRRRHTHPPVQPARPTASPKPKPNPRPKTKTKTKTKTSTANPTFKGVVHPL